MSLLLKSCFKLRIDSVNALARMVSTASATTATLATTIANTTTASRLQQPPSTQFIKVSTEIEKGALLNDDVNSLTTADLMAASLHMGHSKSSWEPTMLPYVYGKRHGLNIINLSETMACLKRARDVVFEIARNGGNVLFVGTRPMLHELVVRTACENRAFYCTNWVGGTITNKERVLRRSVGYDPDKVTQSLKAQSSEPEQESEDNKFREYEQKRQPKVALPDLLILLDYPNTKWAVREANIAHIPVVAICDTDCDPSLVQYPIPANDDSLKGVSLIAGVLGRASREGFVQWKKDEQAQAQAQAQQRLPQQRSRKY